VGDPLYGPGADGASAEGARLLLHAAELGLPHPNGGAPMTWISPAPF